MNTEKESKKENSEFKTMKSCICEQIKKGLSKKQARNKCRIMRGFKIK